MAKKRPKVILDYNVDGMRFDDNRISFKGVTDKRYETGYLADRNMDLKAKRKAALRRLKAMRSKS